jgi:Ca2+-binding RTX toxin-like protein
MKRRGISIALLACVLAALAPGTASAIEIRGTNPYFDLVDAAGVKNDVVVTVPAPGQARVTDAAGVIAGPPISPSFPFGCTQESPTSALCNVSFLQDHFVNLGPGDDSYVLLQPMQLSPRVYGEDGNDTITTVNLGAPSGLPVDDLVYGGNGDDTLSTGDGKDFLNAGPGDDVCTGGPGRDTCRADDGNDRCDLGAGSDTCSLRKGRDTCLMGPGSDDCLGGKGRDVCDGGPGGKDRSTGCERSRGFENGRP